MFLWPGCAAPEPPTGVPMETAVRKEPWHTPYASGSVLRTAHYDIYTTVADRMILKYLPGFMEAAYQRYVELTGFGDLPGGRKMSIYMLGTRKEWQELTRSVVRHNVEAYLEIQAGGYCYRGIGVFWHMGGTGTLSVAAHEGLHQFLHFHLRNHLPVWLEEGLCTTAEGFAISGDCVTFTPARNVGRFNNLRAAILQDRWLKLRRLLEMNAAEAIVQHEGAALGYYGQLWALALYLRSKPEYRAGVSRLLADARAGRLHRAIKVPPHALPELQLRGAIYNRTVSLPLFKYYVTGELESFERGYRQFAMKLAMLPYAAGC